MNLVKWLRKYNAKIMAIVVILIMIAFVLGTLIQQLSRGPRYTSDTFAYFDDNKKITHDDLAAAQQELGILQELRADFLLRNITIPMLRTPDLKALMLGELLFSERRMSPEIVRNIKQLIASNEYRISSRQIDDFYAESVAGKDVLWLLLSREAQQAGIKVPNKDAGSLLARVLPQIFKGATYSQVIGSIVNRQGIPEEKVLAIFAKLLAVLNYADATCSSEDITGSQVMLNTSFDQETMNVEFVKFDSSVFAKQQSQPSDEKITEQFNKYKNSFAGSISQDNPCGFGYKLPDMVGLEYMAVKLDDVSKIVPPPTQEEAEDFYQKYKDQFVEQVPSDPNDPNSPATERTKSYVEMAGKILKQLEQNKINSKAEKILQEARMLTEAGLEKADIELTKLSSEQFSKLAGDYKTAAEQMSEKYKIKVYTGKTGLLSAADIRTDKDLSMLFVSGHDRSSVVPLPQVVFAIDEIGISKLGPFDIAKPRMYENIGPFNDGTGLLTALIRVVEAQKACEPNSLDVSFSSKTISLDSNEPETKNGVYSVKEKVAEDLKKVAAMETTKAKAQEFIKQIAKGGWEDAVKKFNEQYQPADHKKQDEPNALRLQDLKDLKRFSNARLETFALQTADSPTARFSIDVTKKTKQLIDRLYSLVPQDNNTLASVPAVMEFLPDMSCYIIKSISINRIDQSEYEKIKAAEVYKEDIIQSQSMVAIHFNPENILNRMNYKPVVQKQADANAPARPVRYRAPVDEGDF
jgi:hypothetical protein